MPTTTSNYGLLKPLVNNATDQDLWGGQLNADMDELDGLILTAMNFVSWPETASFSVVAPTVGSNSTGSSKNLFICDATAGAITASLPAASAAENGFTVAFKKKDSGANTITVAAVGSDKIDGASTFVLSIQYSWLILVSDGTSSWSVISDFASTVGLPTLAANNVFTGTNDFTANTLTAQTQLSTDNSDKVATTAFFNNLSRSITTNGYYTLPGGLIIQWGNAGSGTSGSVSFPLTFPSEVFSVVGNGAPGSPSSGINSGFTVRSFTYQNASGNPFCWVAVGN